MEEEQKEKIIEELMIEYGGDLVRLAFSYVKDKETAKDIVQNTFIKAYENLDSFRHEASLKTWLYRITINLCKDYLRSWHYRMVQTKSILENTMKTVLPVTEEIVIQKSESEVIRGFLFTLPQKYREVIYLYYYKSLSLAEIAEVTGLNLNTVKTRLRRGKEKLKTLIEEAGIYGEV